MEKKILKSQLYFLFILTTLNLIYFYYRDNLPDNYYEITYQNQSINFFTYYFFTVLANFGYWCGIWVTVSFITFAILHTFVLTKKKDVKNQIVIAALLPFTPGPRSSSNVSTTGPFKTLMICAVILNSFSFSSIAFAIVSK